MELEGLGRYMNFGFRGVWLEGLFRGREYWLENNTLGPYQKISFARHLKDAELIDKNKNLTELFYKLSKIYEKEPQAVWQIIWVNLCVNSPLYKWYVEEIPWGYAWKKEELVKKLCEKGFKERTARNAINALTNTFENSPLGEWFGKK